MSNVELIKSLRQQTGLPLKEIKQAIEQVGEEVSEEKIIEQLKQQGALKHQNKSHRQTNQGGIFTYSHEYRLGVMLELQCETDFVARSDDFVELGQDLCLHVAAYLPEYVRREDISAEVVDKEKRIIQDLMEEEDKPPEIKEKIVEGKLDKYLNSITLEGQLFIKDNDLSVADYVAKVVQKTGENIQIKRFVVMELNG